MPKIQSAPSGLDRETPILSERQREGRAINAVAELLMRKLFVPRIFLESKPSFFSGAGTSNLRRVDLLAIDRAGSGDIHVVELKLGRLEAASNSAALERTVKALLEIVPAHFKYLAVDTRSLELVLRQQLFAENGIGRIGIIEVVEKASAPPEARIAIQPERFRVSPEWIKRFDNFQKKNAPDMEIRD